MAKFLRTVFTPILVLLDFFKENSLEAMIITFLMGVLALLLIAMYQGDNHFSPAKFFKSSKEEKPTEVFKGSRFIAPSKSKSKVITSLEDVQKDNSSTKAKGNNSKIIRSLNDLKEK